LPQNYDQVQGRRRFDLPGIPTTRQRETLQAAEDWALIGHANPRFNSECQYSGLSQKKALPMIILTTNLTTTILTLTGQF
jgi:hypothetical protein